MQDAELLQIVTEAFNDAYDILYSEDGWKEEKKNDEGDVVVSKKSKKGKSYKLVIVFDNYLTVWASFAFKSSCIKASVFFSILST